MELTEAIKKMKLIERTITQLKKEGYTVYVENSEKMILDSKERSAYNSEKNMKEAMRGVPAYGSVQHSFSELEHDYFFYF